MYGSSNCYMEMYFTISAKNAVMRDYNNVHVHVYLHYKWIIVWLHAFLKILATFNISAHLITTLVLLEEVYMNLETQNN